ncbi:MAG: hypothetical protein M3520_04915 [Actinomycetota bacterium]|jgi:hypothetical protein|nr:hypothetical protein [Actinomycetota bacterium]
MATYSRPLATSPFNKRRLQAPEPQQFEIGERVTHDRYGLGRVVGVEGLIATRVDFGNRILRVPLGGSDLHRL